MNRESGKPFGQITFSGGVAQVDLDGDPRAALGQADRALYRAKESGRNQVLCA
jgi:diguanylate cyclase